MGDRVLRNAGRLTEAATLRNPLLQGIRNTVAKFATGFPVVQHKMANQLAEMDIGYPDSPLTAHHGHVGTGPKAGERWPDKLPTGPRGARFLAFGPPDAAAALAAKFPRLVVAASEHDPGHATALRLVRPDGYVGFAGSAKDQAPRRGVPRGAGDRLTALRYRGQAALRPDNRSAFDRPPERLAPARLVEDRLVERRQLEAARLQGAGGPADPAVDPLVGVVGQVDDLEQCLEHRGLRFLEGADRVVLRGTGQRREAFDREAVEQADERPVERRMLPRSSLRRRARGPSRPRRAGRRSAERAGP